MEAFLDQFFNLAIMAQAAPILLKGFLTTLLLCVVVIPIGLVTGLGLAMLSLSRKRWVRWAAVVYTDFFRALPPLVLLILIYAGLPFAGIELTAFASVVIAFMINNSSYYGECFRAGIESVGDGQWEAARSTGLTWPATFGFVVFPQAGRNILPDLISNTIEIIKLTSLASIVALPELVYYANMARSASYNSSPIVLAALIYLVLLWPCVRLLSRLENTNKGG